jgi:hypothetical protein
MRRIRSRLGAKFVVALRQINPSGKSLRIFRNVVKPAN